MAELTHLLGDIGKFLDVYRILTPENRAAFEAQMDKLVNGVDDRTRRIYRALHQAAKDGLSVEAAIDRMKQASLNPV